jgi:hypothetical protein
MAAEKRVSPPSDAQPAPKRAAEGGAPTGTAAVPAEAAAVQPACSGEPAVVGTADEYRLVHDVVVTQFGPGGEPMTGAPSVIRTHGQSPSSYGAELK